MRKDKYSCVLGVALIIGLFSCFSLIQAANYTLTVNGATKTGSWNRFYERCVASCHAYTVIHGYYGVNTIGALKKGHDEAGFQYWRCHGILDADVGVYTEDGSGNPVYTWTNFDAILDSVKNAGMKPILELSFMPPALASATGGPGLWYGGVSPVGRPPKDWSKWKNLVSAIIQHVETRYGLAEVRNNWFFELWNEPDWMYTGLTPYLQLYDSTAVAVKATDSLIRLGGPAQSGPSSIGSITSLISNAGTRFKLDFVSWHRYANDGGYGGSNSNPNSLNSFALAIDSLLGRLDPNRKLININDEWGPTYNGDIYHDREDDASFVAKTIHLLNSNDTVLHPRTPPYGFGYWTISNIYEENNPGANSTCYSPNNYGMLLRGSSAIPASQHIAKPVFNAYRLLHKLGATKLSCTGGTTNDGINAVATISTNNDSIQVLVYNHYNGGTANSSTVDNVALTFNNIPFAPDSIRAEHFIVDVNHSNSYRKWVSLGSPTSPTAEQWDTLAKAAQLAHYDSVSTVILTGTTWTKTFTQNYYSVELLILTRAKPVQSAIKSDKILRNAAPLALNAEIRGGRIMLTHPGSGNYTAQLFSTTGQKVFEAHGWGAGTVGIALPKLTAGAFVLRCTGQKYSLIKRVVVKP